MASPPWPLPADAITGRGLCRKAPLPEGWSRPQHAPPRQLRSHLGPSRAKMQIPGSGARLMPGERAAPQAARRTCHLPLGGLDTSVTFAIHTTSGWASRLLGSVVAQGPPESTCRGRVVDGRCPSFCRAGNPEAKETHRIRRQDSWLLVPSWPLCDVGGGPSPSPRDSVSPAGQSWVVKRCASPLPSPAPAL